MRYSYEYKRKCVEMYKEGKWPETPEWIRDQERFRRMIREWVRMEEANGLDVLKHKGQNKEWKPEERLELVSKVLAGASISSVAIAAGINSGLLYQ
ncbi:MAG: helix-turn-helix domain-containing protein, partial [Lachnospiraceae bacterium]|nr:helix-turn-helix domain-containing protein [Lachnospiraceae bacterium]